MSKIIIGILILIIANITMYGILIKINWNIDRYLYVKNDNKNIIGILVRIYTYIVIILIILIMFIYTLGMRNIIFLQRSITGDVSGFDIFLYVIILSFFWYQFIIYIRNSKIYKKRVIIILELVFTTFFFNTLIFKIIYVLIIPHIIIFIFNNTYQGILEPLFLYTNIYYVTAFLFLIHNFRLSYIRTRRFLTIENNFLKKYSHYYKGEKKIKFITNVYNGLSYEDKKKFIKNYHKIYENKKEYKNDKFNVINYKYFPILMAMLIILFSIIGLTLGKLYITNTYVRIHIYSPSMGVSIIGNIIVTIILIYLIGILFFQSYLYNLENFKIKNIRIKSRFQIAKNCHPIFKEVHCYRNFEDFMLGKEMPQKSLGIRKILLVIIIVVLVVCLYITSNSLMNASYKVVEF